MRYERPVTNPPLPAGCAKSTFCVQVYDWTGNVWLAESANWLLSRPVWILARSWRSPPG